MLSNSFVKCGLLLLVCFVLTSEVFSQQELERLEDLDGIENEEDKYEDEVEPTAEAQDPSSEVIPSGGNVPENPCSICKEANANSCLVSEKTIDDNKQIQTTVKCKKNGNPVTERTFTKTNPRPEFSFERIYLREVNTYSYDSDSS